MLAQLHTPRLKVILWETSFRVPYSDKEAKEPNTLSGNLLGTTVIAR